MDQNEKVTVHAVGTEHTSAKVTLRSDYFDGKILDTQVEIHGIPCWVSGDDRMKFVTELQSLIDKYKI